MFIADMHGNYSTSITYNQYYGMVDVQGEIKKAIIAKSQSKAESAANLRQSIIADMRAGRHSCLFIDTMVAQWKDYNADDQFTKFFDYDYITNNDNKKQWLKADEDYDSNKNQGFFEVSKDWFIVILYNMSSEYSDDEIVQSNLDEINEIFGIDKFRKVYIRPE